MEEERVWVRFLDSTLRFRSRNGRLDADEICKKWKLDPESLIIGPDAIGVGDDGLSKDTVGEIRQAASEVGAGDGKSQHTPFLLEASRETSVPRLLSHDALVEGIEGVCVEMQSMLMERLSKVPSEEAKYRARFPSSRQAICSLKQKPCMLWEGVGTGLVDPDDRLLARMKPSQVTVLMAPSGSGKTRSLIELSCQRWSLFFVASQPLVGFGRGSNDVKSAANMLMGLLPSNRAIKLDPEDTFAVDAGVNALIVSRLALLKAMKERRPLLTPKEWAFFQVEFPDVFDVSRHLVTRLLALAAQDESRAEPLAAALSTSMSRFLDELNWSDGMIVVDEAQALLGMMPGVFSSTLTPEQGQGLLNPLVLCLCKIGELRSPIFISGTGSSMLQVRNRFLSGMMKELDVGEVYRLQGFDEHNIKPFLDRFIDTNHLDVDGIIGSFTGRRRLLSTSVERYVMEASPRTDWFTEFGLAMVLKSGEELGMVRTIYDDAKRLWNNVHAKAFVQQLLFTYYLSGMGYVVTSSSRSTMTLVDCGFAMLLEADTADEKEFAPIVPLIEKVTGEDVEASKSVIMEEPLMVYALWRHMPRGTLQQQFINVSVTESAAGENYERYAVGVGALENALDNKVPADVFGVDTRLPVYNKKYRVLKSKKCLVPLIKEIQNARDLDEWIDAVEDGGAFPTYARIGAIQGVSGPDILCMLEDDDGGKLPVVTQMKTSKSVGVAQAFATLDVRRFHKALNCRGSKKLQDWCSAGYVRIVMTTHVCRKGELAYQETRRSNRRKASAPQQVQPLSALWAGERVAGIVGMELLHALEETNHNIKRARLRS